MAKIRIGNETMEACRAVAKELGVTIDDSKDEQYPNGDWSVDISPEGYERVLQLCREGSTAAAAIQLVLIAVRGVR